jgi:hypothetical protein
MKNKIASLLILIPHFGDSKEDSQTYQSLFPKLIKKLLHRSIDLNRARDI